MALDLHTVVPQRVSAAAIARSSVLLAAVGAVALLAGCGKKEARGFLDPAAAASNDLAEIVVTPKRGIVDRKAPVRFAAYGRTANGDSVAVAVTWASTGGTITPEGEFTSDRRGDYWVRAATAFHPATDSALVLVDPVTRVTMSSKVVTVRTAESHPLSVTAEYASGEEAVVPIVWTATAGTVDSNGIFQAPATPGEVLVVATAASGAADTARITVALPVVLTGLRVDTGTDSLEARQSRLVKVEGVWSDGTTSPVPVDFVATGGTINADGLFVAGDEAGGFSVTARARAAPLEATASIAIRLRPLSRLQVYPEVVQMLPGGTQEFTGSGLTVWGGLRAVTVTWAATGGTITPSGQYVAGNTLGNFWVIGTIAGTAIADTVPVRIFRPAATLSKVVLDPPAVALPSGQRKQFTVSGLWSDGTSVAPPVTWTATGGTISLTGSYLAGSQPGTYRVIARQTTGTLADSSVVVITAPVLSRLEIAPGSTTLQTLATVQFGVTGAWSDGTSVPPTVSWSATGGTISSSGLYRAGSTPGTYRVIAQHAGGTLADTSGVVVTGAVLQGVSVTPATATLATGAVQQFQVAGSWSGGGTGAPAVTWSATGGVISSTGRFVAMLTPGTFRIIAKANGTTLADTSTVTLTATAAAPTVTTFSLTPMVSTIPRGGTVQFQPTATWSDGASRAATVSYVAAGGTISVDGLYRAGQVAGTFMVVASCSCGKADTSGVIVTGPTSSAPVIGIELSPDATSLQTGQQQQFTVTGRGSDGSSIATLVNWTATGGAINTSGAYTAGSTVGTYRVIATQQGGSLADTSAVTITAPPPPPPAGSNNMYFNSAEAGCGTDSNVLFCDDFEDGDWYTKNCDQANASGGLLQTDGWCGTIYNAAGLSGGTARCGGAGLRSNCAATTGMISSNTGNMADHGLVNGQGVNEVWVRFYTKPLSGYQFGAEKMLTFNDGSPGGAGIRWGNLSWNCGGSTSSSGNVTMGFPVPMDVCQSQNQGGGLTIQAGNWYFYEVHYRLSTPGQSDGLFELWLDNCGPSGTACPATPTLRMRRSDVRNSRASVSEQIKVLWFEAWSNPQTRGERYWDQIKVARVGPIGFMR